MASTGREITDEPVVLGPFPGGVNNRALEHELPDGTVRAGINVDITNSGRTRRRQGRTAVLEQAGCHSVFGYGSTFLFVLSNVLYKGLPPAHSAVDTVGPGKMYYLQLNGEIYFSNGSYHAKLDTNGVLQPWSVPTPNPIPAVAADATGNLYGGRYQLYMTWQNAAGEESRAIAIGVVTVPDNGRVLLTGLPVSAGLFLNIYMTAINGVAPYRVATLPSGTTSLPITEPATKARELKTLHLQPFPACTHLEEYNGIIYGASGGIVYHTRPLRYGLYDPREDFLLFPADVGMIKRHDTGVYVSADKVYWLNGPGPREFSQKIALPFPAVSGTGITMPKDKDAMWFSERGFVRGRDGGQVEMLTDANVAVSRYTRGVLLFREWKGVRQVVSALAQPTESDFVADDTVDIETVRST